MSEFIRFIDRVPTLPNRKKLTFENDGSIKYATVEYADEPIETGTFLNRACLSLINAVIGYNNVTGVWNPITSTSELTISNFNLSNFINDQRVLLHCINSGILSSDWSIEKDTTDLNRYLNQSIIKKLNNGNILVADSDTTRTYSGAVTIYDTNFTQLYRKYCDRYSNWTNAIELKDGNILFVENDNSTLSFSILSPTLSVIVAKTGLGTYSDFRPQIIQLENNNIMILDYRNNQNNYYPIYVSIISPSGTIIKSMTQISLYGYGLKTKKLKNGNIVIFGGCNGTNNGTIAILDQTGTILYQKYINYVTTSSITELDNGNIFVIYTDWQNNKVNLAIYNNTLEEVKTATNIEKKTPRQLLQMNNGNILYISENNSQSYITIYDRNGNAVISESQIPATSNYLKNANAIQLNSTSILILGENGSSTAGAIIDNNGNILKEITNIFNSFYHPDLVQLNNNNVAIVGNTNNSSAGSNYTRGGIIKLKGSNANSTLNNIPIDTLIEDDKYYELIYNETENKFIAEEVRNAN